MVMKAKKRLNISCKRRLNIFCRKKSGETFRTAVHLNNTLIRGKLFFTGMLDKKKPLIRIFSSPFSDGQFYLLPLGIQTVSCL